MFTYKRPDGSQGVFSRRSAAGLAVQKRWFRRNYPAYVEYTIQPDWPLRISQELHAENGPGEARLRAACRNQQRTRTSIILQYGDPRQWSVTAVA